jgi:diaminopimelate epimerase
MRAGPSLGTPYSSIPPGMNHHFRKMHGAGNDFVLFDARATAVPLTPALIGALCDRRTGIGCDQLVVLEPAEDADVLARFYNQDGGEAGACGNATRCIADLINRQTGQTSMLIRTLGGLLAAEKLPDGQFRVDMGPPRLRAAEIPFAREIDTLHLPLEGDPAACSIGNPHATWFVADVEQEDIARLGPAREHDPLFPERANIGFAQILSPQRIRLRVWERGAGLTLACGSGACAALVNAHRRGLTEARAELILDGGMLVIELDSNGHVLMTGPSVLVFEGSVDLGAFAT